MFWICCIILEYISFLCGLTYAILLYCIENGMYIIAVALILFGNPNLHSSLISFWEILKAGSWKLSQCAVVCTLYEILWKKCNCVSLWWYREGLGVEKIESWLFGDLKREVHYYVILRQVNTLFTHSKDTVDSSFKIRRLLKFAYCVKNVVLWVNVVTLFSWWLRQLILRWRIPYWQSSQLIEVLVKFSFPVFACQLFL